MKPRDIERILDQEGSSVAMVLVRGGGWIGGNRKTIVSMAAWSEEPDEELYAIDQYSLDGIHLRQTSVLAVDVVAISTYLALSDKDNPAQ